MDLELYLERSLAFTARRGPSRVGALVTAARIRQKTGCRVNLGNINRILGSYIR